MSALRAVLIGVVTVAAGLAMALPAQAMVVPVDPGPIAAGRPIWGSGQNLMSVDATEDYWVGPGFAEQITAYYESGRARADQRDVSEAAYLWIRDWVDEHCDLDVRACRATVVFDVDETLLSNIPMYVAMDPQYSDDPVAWNAATKACTQPANAPVRRLYNRVKAMGLTVIVLTGREVTLKPWTRRCLNERGITGWDRLILKPTDDADSASVFKSKVRGHLRREGLRIVASVGDQVSDMALGNLRAGFLLPNPIYYLP